MDSTNAEQLLALALRVEEVIVADAGAPEVQRLEERADDIAAAADALLADHRPDEALDLVGALSVFWQDVGRVDEGRRLAASVLERTAAAASRPRARALLALGQLAFRQGDQDVAAEATRVAAQLARLCGDTLIEGRAELNLARVAFRDGAAERIFEHATRVRSLAGDNLRLQTGAIHMLGWAEYTAGDIAAAMTRFDENVRLLRAAGNRLDCASELANLGDLAAEAGDLDAGARYLRDALDVPGVDRSSYLAPSLVRSAAVLAAQRGRPEAALALFAAADRFYEEFGLIADPGDEVSPEVLDAARAALDGAGAQRARDTAAGWSLPEAVRAAAEALR